MQPKRSSGRTGRAAACAYGVASKSADKKTTAATARSPDAVWPLCFECQLKTGNAGQVVGLGLDIPDAPMQNNRKRAPRLAEPSEKPPGEWNTYEIFCRGDTIECSVNGVPQNRVGKLPVSAGAIALQLEGFPIEFRNVWLEPL